MSLRKHIYFSIFCVLLFSVVLLFWSNRESLIIFDTTLAQANEALKHTQEVSKWMATVQIGILTALGAVLAIDKTKLHPIISVYSFVFLISSLVCSSIVLTGLASISLRLAKKSFHDSYDALIYPIYANFCNGFHLGYFVSLQQWFWGGSLVSLLILIFAAVKSKHKNV